MDATETTEVSLSQLTISSKIDYVTVFTQGKTKLPRFDGKFKWVRGANYRKLTIHDPSPLDLVKLVRDLGNPDIAEVEVATDFSPPRELTPSTRRDQLDRIMIHLFAKGLHPGVVHRELGFSFRGAFLGNRVHFHLRPYNRKLPPAHAQQLHGKRWDPLQVKCYRKGIDQKRHLPPEEHVSRVEVRLSAEGLTLHGLRQIRDLIGFRYRKVLMPYFRHVRSARLPRTKKPQQSLLTILKEKQHQFLLTDWERVGVGTVLPGGKHMGSTVRLLANRAVNDRIGQALYRLEGQMKNVRPLVLA